MKLDFLELGLTDYCQNRCIMCHQSKKYFQKKERAFIDKNIVFKLIDSLENMDFHFNVLYLFWIGEPLLHPDFSEILSRIFKSKNPICNGFVVNSNGLNLKNNNLKTILDCGKISKFSQIILSMDSVYRETYKKIRVGGNHDLMMNNFEELLKQRKEKFPLIIPQMIVMKENQDEVDDFIEQISLIGQKYNIKFEIRGARHEINSDTIYLRPLLFDEEWKTSPLKMKEWEEIIKIWKDKIKKHSSYENIDDIIKLESADPRYIPEGVCSSIFNGVVVTASGKIVPCCGDYFEELVMGDLNKNNFEEIWFGQKYMTLRKLHINSKRDSLPDRCKICYLPEESRISKEDAQKKLNNIIAMKRGKN